MLAVIMMCLSSGIVLLLGCLHLIYTFFGPMLTPRDPALLAQMQSVSPVISREMSMWSAWVGFNVSHSLCAILFGAVYGFLALAHAELLFASSFLLFLGIAVLGTLTVVAWCYWFSIPAAGVSLALIAFIAAIVASKFASP